MDNAEYKSLKKIAYTQAGADDYESLKYFGEAQLKNTRYIKWVSLFIIIASVPAFFVLIGFFTIIVGIAMYFLMYKKLRKKAEDFLVHLENDSELKRD